MTDYGDASWPVCVDPPQRRLALPFLDREVIRGLTRRRNALLARGADLRRVKAYSGE
jgi:hypothetical protein